MAAQESLGDFVARHAKVKERKLPRRGKRSERYKEAKDKYKK